MLDDLADRLRIPTERRRLDDLLAEAHVRQTEAAADEEAVAERPLHLVRGRVRADIEILRRAAQQQIAHAAADEIGRIPQLGQTVEDLERVRVDVLAGNAVLGALADHGRAFSRKFST